MHKDPSACEGKRSQSRRVALFTVFMLLSAKQTQRLEGAPIRQKLCPTLEMLRQHGRVTLSRRKASPKLAVVEKHYIDVGLRSTGLKLQKGPGPRG